MLLVGMMLWRLSFIVSYFVSINIVALCAYGFDKKTAGSSWVRVPEKLLHVLSLAGGSPAALLAQRVFRHKTIKTCFQVVYWLIVCVQLVLILMVSWWVNG